MIRPDTARLPRRFAPRNDKSGGFAPLNLCRDHCQSARCSLSAATDAIGVCYFNDSRYKSAVGAPPISHKNIPDAAASGISLSKKSFQTFSPNCFQNCKINFCSTILQFCRCGGLFNAKGNPDGFLSHFPSLRDLRLGRFFGSLKRTGQSDLSAFSYAVPAFAALRPERPVVQTGSVLISRTRLFRRVRFLCCGNRSKRIEFCNRME